jgi:hypothetical protein
MSNIAIDAPGGLPLILFLARHRKQLRIAECSLTIETAIRHSTISFPCRPVAPFKPGFRFSAVRISVVSFPDHPIHRPPKLEVFVVPPSTIPQFPLTRPLLKHSFS